MQENLTSEADGLSAEIMKLTRDSLMVGLRFMDMALCQLVPIPFDLKGFTSDGTHFFYNTRYVLETYMKDRETLSRDYLHVVFHWVFNHPFVGKGIDRERWNLACDITVENLMLELGVHKTPDPRQAEKLRHIEALKNSLAVLTAETLYRHLADSDTGEQELAELKKLFYRDEHQTWYVENPDEGDQKPEDQKMKTGMKIRTTRVVGESGTRTAVRKTPGRMPGKMTTRKTPTTLKLEERKCPELQRRTAKRPLTPGKK